MVLVVMVTSSEVGAALLEAPVGWAEPEAEPEALPVGWAEEAEPEALPVGWAEEAEPDALGWTEEEALWLVITAELEGSWVGKMVVTLVT